MVFWKEKLSRSEKKQVPVLNFLLIPWPFQCASHLIIMPDSTVVFVTRCGLVPPGQIHAISP